MQDILSDLWIVASLATQAKTVRVINYRDAWNYRVQGTCCQRCQGKMQCACLQNRQGEGSSLHEKLLDVQSPLTADLIVVFVVCLLFVLFWFFFAFFVEEEKEERKGNTHSFLLLFFTNINSIMSKCCNLHNKKKPSWEAECDCPAQALPWCTDSFWTGTGFLHGSLHQQPVSVLGSHLPTYTEPPADTWQEQQPGSSEDQAVCAINAGGGGLNGRLLPEEHAAGFKNLASWQKTG